LKGAVIFTIQLNQIWKSQRDRYANFMSNVL